jgi:hypothetical protein
MGDVTFDVETQAAAAITNIGGDQVVHSAGRPSLIARRLAVFGVALSLAGLGVLVLTGIRTVETLLANGYWPQEASYYLDDVASTWLPAALLLVAGLVIKRFARAVL